MDNCIVGRGEVRTNVLTNQEKVISLYKFIRELSASKQKVVLNVKNYDWYCDLSSIPQDTQNIEVFYRDRVEEERTDTGTALLRVHKPEFQKCPEPDASLLEWLVEGWTSFRNEVHIRKTIEHKVEDKLSVIGKLKNIIETKSFFDEDSEQKSKDEEDTVIVERFEDEESRVNAYKKWLAIRSEWAEKQKIIDQTRGLFTKLYQIHVDLERDSETIEMVVANGYLRDKTNWDINHPVMTRRVKTKYDPIANTMSIEDTEVETELYTMLLHTMGDINLDSINSLRGDLYKNDYHPMDRNDTPEFLRVFIHQLSPESVFSENGEPAEWYRTNRLLMYLSPAFIVRKRVDGTIKAVEQIIENIVETGEIPPHLEDIVSGGLIDIPDDDHEETIEEQLAAVGGESIDILLSKEANKEQLEIAQRIERYNAVLVQGPPGTGKTHTIANLMGHFLAQGKSVLVTSHTKKALTVLKEQVAPGLQNLCVSVLDDSNVDMEKSVDGITDYMSKYTSHELKRQMDSVDIERRQIIADLADTRKKLFSIINRECNSIVLNGEEISPSKAAAFVLEHSEALSYIPGSVRLYESLPVTFTEMTDLYRSNEGINALDELELACELPDPATLLSPTEFEKTWQALREAKQRVASIAEAKGWVIDYDSSAGSLTFTKESGSFQVYEVSEEDLHSLDVYISSFGYIDTWMKHAAVDGKKGGSFRQRWITLVEQIRKTCDYAESIVSEQFGKTITFVHDANLDELVPILQKLREHFAKKGKVTKFDLLLNTAFEKVFSAVTINGARVQSAYDCGLALHVIELSKERNQCAVYWHDLLSTHGVPEFIDLDASEPELIADKWIEPINRYLNWYQQEYALLAQHLSVAHIPAGVVFPQNVLDSELAATDRILTAINDTIPPVVDSCQTVLKIRALEATLQAIEIELQCGKHIGSLTCGNMCQALRAGDAVAYAEAYKTLETLFIKYDLQKKRDELLKKIAPIAPQWAEAIRNRVGVHGDFTVPSKIEDAWKWKQYSGIIADIMKEPFHELQTKSIALSKKYREVTTKIAEKRAWYHLMRRTERDIDMKQALNGWKLTERMIGKGTGKNAPMYKAKARELMAKCQTAVPAWIMPISKALESLDPKTNRFDVIIVDEASQSDVCSLAIAYMAKKLIVVGDDKQVSPMAVGTELDKINALIKMYLDGVVPNAHLYTPTTSLYDVAGMTFQSLLLKEHFRCVPEIIGFSNGLSYDFKIKPLRDASSSILLPAVVNYRVADGERDAIRKENTNEAKAIVALLMACMEQPEYAGKTFGVISMLGDEQAKLIQSLIFEHIDAKDIERRRILCGNASNFQGDQRDVVLLSIVDSNSGSGPLKLQDFGPKEAYRKRYNVAASRAKDQMWVVDSLDSANDLKPGDIRKQLIDYSLNPAAFENTNEEIEKKSESPFEASVARTLTSRGYHLIQQWEVGAYRLDMVAVCGKKCVAIECDGERWHSGEAKIREDMERQTILERIGWRFIRIRGSEYYRNPDATMERVISELGVYGIDPEDQYLAPKVTRTTELLQRTKARAATILSGFDSPCSNGMDLGTIAFALNTKESEKNVVSAQKHDVMEDDNQTISRVTPTESIPAKQIKEPAQITVAEIVNNRNPDEEPKTASTIGSVHTLTVISEPSAVTESKQKHDENGTHTVPQKSSKDLEELTVPTLSDERPASNDVIALITTAGIEYVDKRNNGGALWIIGNQDDLAELVKKCKKLRVYFTFKAGGGRATKNRDGWWAK